MCKEPDVPPSSTSYYVIFNTQLFFKKYKPNDYWTKRGKIYYDSFTRDDNTQREETALIEYLQILQFESVLEFGCGFGRISRLLSENFKIKHYKAFDLSQDQINNAKKLCENYEIDFEVSSIQDILMSKNMT